MAKKMKQAHLRVPYGLSVHDHRETRAVARVISEHRTALGKETNLFERNIAKIFEKKYGVMVNSGSSANLLAFEILNLPKGSEVITPALTFNTTVAPIIQKGLVPVFVDVAPHTYLVNVDHVERAITEHTRALMIPLLIGNVPDMARLRAIANRHHLWFIEDSCDTLGARYREKPTGVYSDISTTSFFGSHVINALGGGGMICVNNPVWRDQLRVLRGWGRTSSLFADAEDMKKRYITTLSGIPYDGKFIFTELGYNFLPLEVSAAFGLVQLKKLPHFTRARSRNFARLHAFLKQWSHWFDLPLQTPHTITNWLAFPLCIKKNAPFSRFELVSHLEKCDIQTRPVFTGNITRQPAFAPRDTSYPDYQVRVVSSLTLPQAPQTYPEADAVMERAFLIGCHQGITAHHLACIEKVFKNFLKRYDQ